MTCKDFQERLIEAMASGETPEQRHALNNHSAQCADCTALEKDWRAIAQRAATSTPVLPDVFWNRQRQSIMERVTPRRSFQWRPQVAFSLTLAGVITAVYFYGPRSASELVPASQVAFLQEMDMMQNLDILEKWDGSKPL